eukprot:8568669-Alexandrium_andersonii.AAC.1
MDGWPIQGILRDIVPAEAHTAAAQGPAEAPRRRRSQDRLSALLDRAGRQPHRSAEASNGRAASQPTCATRACPSGGGSSASASTSQRWRLRPRSNASQHSLRLCRRGERRGQHSRRHLPRWQAARAPVAGWSRSST